MIHNQHDKNFYNLFLKYLKNFNYIINQVSYINLLYHIIIIYITQNIL